MIHADLFRFDCIIDPTLVPEANTRARDETDGAWLDPLAGGDKENEMSMARIQALRRGPCADALLRSKSCRVGSGRDECGPVDDKLFFRLVVGVRGNEAEPLYNAHPSVYPAKNRVFSIKPRSWR